MGANGNDIEKRLWAAADQLRANSNLMPSGYSGPVLGLLLVRYAEKWFAEAEARIGPVGLGTQCKISEADYHAEGIIFLPARIPVVASSSPARTKISTARSTSPTVSAIETGGNTARRGSDKMTQKGGGTPRQTLRNHAIKTVYP